LARNAENYDHNIDPRPRRYGQVCAIHYNVK
jgi:hypothetical protein